MTKAMFPFSADPITYGHIDLIQRTAPYFDEFVVGIGINPEKDCLFPLEERLEMVRHVLTHLPNVRVDSYEGLLVDYAYEQRIPFIIRGVRNEQDFSYETLFHEAGASHLLGIETFFLPAKPSLAHVSSTMVKNIQKDHGSTHEYVPLFVKQKLEERISQQYLVGITGEIGVGKSTISKQWIDIGKQNGIAVHHVELDHIGHAILEVLTAPAYLQIRKDVVEAFGDEVKLPDGTINRKALGDIVFSDIKQVRRLNELLHKPIMVRLRNELREKKGLIVLNAALLAEAETLYLCNNNVVLVTADKQSQERRLREKKLGTEQIMRRLASQYTTEQKKRKLEEEIEKQHQGEIWTVDNSDGRCVEDIERVFGAVVKELRVK